MNKKLILTLVVLAAVGLGIYLIYGIPKYEAPMQEKPAATKTPSKTTTTAPQTTTPTYQSAPQPPAGGLVQVAVKGFAFVGKDVRIDAGTTIMWKNFDAVPHTVTSDTGVFDKTLLPGQTFSYKFNTPGIYMYKSSIDQGMTGSITVR